MGTRIFCFVIVIVFLLSVVGFAGYAIFQYVTEEEGPAPKTSTEATQEILDSINLGDLEDYEPSDESIESRRIETLEEGEDGLYVVGSDVVTIEARYALAESGKLIYDTAQTESGQQGISQSVSSFCQGWPESLTGLKAGGRRRLFVPAAEIGRCLDVSQQAWLAEYDMIIDIRLVGIADRPVLALEDLENLGELEEYAPPAGRPTERSFEDILSGSGPAVEATDIVVVRARYALAGSGQIFFQPAAGEDGSLPSRTLSPDSFCSFWPEALTGLRAGGKRRLLLPEAEVVTCDLPIDGWVEAEDLVIEVELAGIVDRAFTSLAPRRDPIGELDIEDTVVGEGREVAAGDSVVANYIGILASDGTIFDSGEEASFSLNGVIAGWREGLVGMRVGGTRILSIPAAQAYGQNGQGSIPPNADLIFQVELVGIEQVN